VVLGARRNPGVSERVHLYGLVSGGLGAESAKEMRPPRAKEKAVMPRKPRCRFCGKKFHKKGIGIHQRCCPARIREAYGETKPVEAVPVSNTRGDDWHSLSSSQRLHALKNAIVLIEAAISEE
jgi:ribosomal protein L37AE/L43A